MKKKKVKIYSIWDTELRPHKAALEEQLSGSKEDHIKTASFILHTNLDV
jgi:hypothetical protein